MQLLLLLLQPIAIGLLLAIVVGSDVFEIYEETNITLFVLSCAFIWIGMFNSIQEVCKERVILKREYLANLKLPIYILSKLIVLGFICFVQSLSLVLVISVFIGLPETGVLLNSFADFLIIAFTTIFTATTLGLAISSLAKTGEQAMTITPFVLIFKLLFSGILFDLSGLANIASYLTISRWSVSLLGITANLNEIPLRIQEILPAYERQIEDIYVRTAGNVLRNYAMLGLFILSLSISSILVLRNVAKDSR